MITSRWKLPRLQFSLMTALIVLPLIGAVIGFSVRTWTEPTFWHRSYRGELPSQYSGQPLYERHYAYYELRKRAWNGRSELWNVVVTAAPYDFGGSAGGTDIGPPGPGLNLRRDKIYLHEKVLDCFSHPCLWVIGGKGEEPVSPFLSEAEWAQLGATPPDEWWLLPFWEAKIDPLISKIGSTKVGVELTDGSLGQPPKAARHP